MAISGFALERLGPHQYTSKEKEGKETKFICSGVVVYAETEEMARQIAATPRALQPGQKILPNNTIDPPPPYSWCVDEDPAAWLDPTKTSCKSFPVGPEIETQEGRGYAQFLEVVR